MNSILVLLLPKTKNSIIIKVKKLYMYSIQKKIFRFTLLFFTKHANNFSLTFQTKVYKARKLQLKTLSYLHTH